MKKIHVKCPICDKIDKIENTHEYKCSYCLSEHKVYECKIQNIKEENREIEYLEECFKKSILTYDKTKANKYIKLILNKDSGNYLINYYTIEENDKKIEYLLNNNIDSRNIYFILKNDLLKEKELNKDLLYKLFDKYNENLEIYSLKQKFEQNIYEDKLLYDNLYNEQIELKSYIDPNKHKFIGIFSIVCSIIIAIITSLICTLAVYEDCIYGTIVLIAIVPSIIMNVGIIKYFKINNNLLKIIIFVFVFYVLTYFMTIHLRNVSFIESFKDHIKHIINSIPEVLESITKHSDIEWGEKE